MTAIKTAIFWRQRGARQQNTSTCAFTRYSKKFHSPPCKQSFRPSETISQPLTCTEIRNDEMVVKHICSKQKKWDTGFQFFSSKLVLVLYTNRYRSALSKSITYGYTSKYFDVIMPTLRPLVISS